VSWAIEEKNYSQAYACALIGLRRKRTAIKPSAKAMRRSESDSGSLRVSAVGLATGVSICCCAGKG